MELNYYHAAGNIWQLIIVSIHGVSGSKLEIYGDIEIRNGFMNYGPLCSNTDSGPYDLLHTISFQNTQPCRKWLFRLDSADRYTEYSVRTLHLKNKASCRNNVWYNTYKLRIIS